jgi:hypothetical protein
MKCPICNCDIEIREIEERGNHFCDFELYYYNEIACYLCELRIREFYKPQEEGSKEKSKELLIKKFKKIKGR